jgi:hypothetical protein
MGGARGRGGGIGEYGVLQDYKRAGRTDHENRKDG